MEHLQFKHKARVGLEPPTGKLLCSKVKASFLADSTEEGISAQSPTAPEVSHISTDPPCISVHAPPFP